MKEYGVRVGYMIYSELRLNRLLSKVVEQRKLMSPVLDFDYSELSKDELIELVDGIENGTITEDRINELLSR